jgi:nuclear pore complex protein Nup62
MYACVYACILSFIHILYFNILSLIKVTELFVYVYLCVYIYACLLVCLYVQIQIFIHIWYMLINIFIPYIGHRAACTSLLPPLRRTKRSLKNRPNVSMHFHPLEIVRREVHLYIFICIYVCIYIFIYVCIWIYLDMDICECMYINTFICFLFSICIWLVRIEYPFFITFYLYFID